MEVTTISDMLVHIYCYQNIMFLIGKIYNKPPLVNL